MKFSLNKIYLDCIDDKGNCFIIYYAKLKWLIFNVNYSSIIISDTNEKTKEFSSFLTPLYPTISNDLSVNNFKLEFSGKWQKIDKEIRLNLYKNVQKNEVIWHCHHPKTKTKIQYRKDIYEGLGYAETILLPIKPWKLPIKELRWGRFLAPNTTIIWINWQGTYPLNKLYYNNILFEDAIFDNNQILFNQKQYCLIFEKPIVVRQGKLSTLIKKSPWLKIFFNKKILNTLEIKYKSLSTFLADSKPIEKGWSLFEIVVWEK